MGDMNTTRGWATIDLDDNKRHFAVGDIHGHMSTFLSALDAINYDPAGDCIYSVGDIIDRGLHSVEAIEFFNQPNNFAIRGNHEQMLVNFKEWENIWMYPPNGGPATIYSLEQNGKDIAWLTEYCKSTPLILDVGDDVNGFRLVHAEMPFWDSEVQLREYFASTEENEIAEGELLWGREDITACMQNVNFMRPAEYQIPVHPERSKRSTFCGHTPISQIIRAHNTSWIDTARGGTMTMVNALTNELYVVPEQAD